jgi:hypothetical protein
MPVPPDMRTLYQSIEELARSPGGPEALRYCVDEVKMIKLAILTTLYPRVRWWIFTDYDPPQQEQ